MAKITFNNKETFKQNDLPDKNKVTADDVNEIKTSVNALYDSVNLKSDKTYVDAEILVKVDKSQLPEKLYGTDVGGNQVMYDIYSIVNNEDWDVNFVAAKPLDKYRVSFNYKINSIVDSGSIVTSVKVNGSPYTLGDVITAGSELEINVNATGLITLKTTAV